ncbi:MAG: hypothetical protein KDC98_23680 [Planctomycetes bacterium]|nr:hypothetical protein [Planctomycetota bacterium]
MSLPGPRRTRRTPAGIAASSLGALCAIAATVGLVVAESPSAVMIALSLHGLATFLVMRAAMAARASHSEVVLFTAAAAALPGIGALSCWWFCAGGAALHASNAHAENDPLLQRGARGNADLARELGVNSYTQVVRHGSLEEKRNLLRRLGQLGTPRHLSIVRHFLFEDEPELRLCAYAELARIGHRHEHAIGELRRVAESRDAPADLAAALMRLAEANRGYAISGVLDDEMARYWSDQAEQIAARAIAADPECHGAHRILALALADRGALDEAWEVITSLSAASDPAVELARAEVAFRRHDRVACCLSLQRLQAAGTAVPEWLQTVANAGAIT